MNFLIIKTSALGDIIHALPVIDFLKKHFPDSTVDWVSEKSCADFLKRHREINQVIEVDTKRWRKSLFSLETWSAISKARRQLKGRQYDIAFDLQGNTKSGVIMSWVFAERKVGLAKSFAAEWPNTLFTNEKYNLLKEKNIREDYLTIVQQSLKIDEVYSPQPLCFALSPEEKALAESFVSAPGATILICPGSAWENKRLSIDTLKELVRLIHSKNPEVLCLFSWGTEEERQLCEMLYTLQPKSSQVLPRLELAVLQHLMSKVDLVFAMDSLPLHLAGTTKTHTVGIFGPSNALKYLPVGPQNLGIQGKCPYNQSFDKRCPLLRTCKTGACTKNLTAQEIFNAICSLRTTLEGSPLKDDPRL